MLKFIIIGIIVLIGLGLLFLYFVPICDGGELFTGCGKVLFPWTKKIKLPSGRYCCTACYARDLKLFADIKDESKDIKIQFKVKDEEFDLGDTTDNDSQSE